MGKNRGFWGVKKGVEKAEKRPKKGRKKAEKRPKKGRHSC